MVISDIDATGWGGRLLEEEKMKMLKETVLFIIYQ